MPAHAGTSVQSLNLGLELGSTGACYMEQMHLHQCGNPAPLSSDMAVCFGKYLQALTSQEGLTLHRQI